MSAQAATLEGKMDAKDNAVKTAVLPSETSGAITLPGGTLICYGTVNGTETFAKEFQTVPKVAASTDSYVVTTTGITSSEIFDYIAIGEEAKDG